MVRGQKNKWFLSFGRGSLSENFEPDPGQTLVKVLYTAESGHGEVDHPALFAQALGGPAVIDADNDFFAVADVGDLDHRVEREAPHGACHFFVVKFFHIGRGRLNAGREIGVP